MTADPVVRLMAVGDLMLGDSSHFLGRGVGSHIRRFGSAYAPLDERWRGLAVSDPVNGRLTADREVFLPGDLLPKVDRMSMASSLEVRVPFLDHEVVQFAASLPLDLKLRGNTSKFVPVIPFWRCARWKNSLNCFSVRPYMRLTFCFSRS